jgi:hypothetical protein
MPSKNYLMVICVMSLLALNGCGEISYKRGAGATDFLHEKETCSSKHTVKKDIDSCLEQKGWIVVGIENPLKIMPSPEPISAEVADKVIEAKAPLFNPAEKISISSWWKAGSNPDTLIKDSEACVLQLGKKHQTLSNMSLVTRGLIRCMQEKSWHVLKQ